MKNIMTITLLMTTSIIHTGTLDNPDAERIISKFLSNPTQEKIECFNRCIDTHKRKTNNAQEDKELVDKITDCFLKEISKSRDQNMLNRSQHTDNEFFDSIRKKGVWGPCDQPYEGYSHKPLTHSPFE